MFGGSNGGSWDMRTPYRGTIFRLPLRREGDGSRLGDAYSHEKALELLEGLRARGPELLLFLKNVRSIEVYSRGLDGEPDRRRSARLAADPPPPELHTRLSFRVDRRVEGGGEDMQTIAQLVKSVPQREQLYEQLVASETTLEWRSLTMRLVDASNQIASSSRWVVCNGLTMTAEMRALCLSSDARGSKLIPWAGVAAKVGGYLSVGAELKGAAFSVLPLPIETGLPVHINGYFELATDRERLWTLREGLTGVAAVKAAWNQAVLNEVVSRCYCKLLCVLASTSPQADHPPADLARYFKLWPTDATAEPWGGMVRSLYEQLLSQSVLPGPERWLKPSSTDNAQKPVLRAEQITAELPDLKRAAWKLAYWDTVNAELARAGQGVLKVVMPKAVLELLQSALSVTPARKLTVVSPILACKALRAQPPIWPGRVSWLEGLNRPDGIRLLRFCLSEQRDLEGRVGDLAGRAKNAVGLPFVPILAPPGSPWQSTWATLEGLQGDGSRRLVLLSNDALTAMGLGRNSQRCSLLDYKGTRRYLSTR